MGTEWPEQLRKGSVQGQAEDLRGARREDGRSGRAQRGAVGRCVPRGQQRLSLIKLEPIP